MILNGAIADAVLASFRRRSGPASASTSCCDAQRHAVPPPWRVHVHPAGGVAHQHQPVDVRAHDKVVQPGDLVGIDTDANGYEGYVLDVSRTFLCGDEGTPGRRRPIASPMIASTACAS